MIDFEERFSDSPLVERVWRSSSEKGGMFLSIATHYPSMVVWHDKNTTWMSVRGPETKASLAECPVHTDFIGIEFKFGTVFPLLPAANLLDNQVDLPHASSRSFWLNGAAWQFPDYHNADTFIERLVRDGALAQEPVVDAAVRGHLNDVSLRSVQRRFLRATGLTHNAARQIERARYATVLLQQGVPILDVVYLAGYSDQPHLTRALKYFIGQTPAQTIDKTRSQQLSFLFKTAVFS